MRNDDPFHLKGLIIRGFEDDNESGGDGGNDGDNEENEESEEEENNNSGGGENEDTSGLKSALQKERRDRKRLEKELKEFRKFKEEQEDKDKSESEKARKEAEREREKAQKLSVKLRKAAEDNLVTKLATKMKFVDLDDALSLVDRSAFEVDQDEDDPSDITIDEKSVKSALEALAKKKPHLLGDGNGGPPASGSKFGGGRKSQEQLDEEALMEKYPALRR